MLLLLVLDVFSMNIILKVILLSCSAVLVHKHLTCINVSLTLKYYFQQRGSST